MSTRSEMCHKTIEECAWELVSEPDHTVSYHFRKKMVGEFGPMAVIAAVEGADSTRELMGFPRKYLSLKRREELKAKAKEAQNACTHWY